MHWTLKAAVFQRNLLTAFFGPRLVTLFSSVRFSLPAFPGLCSAGRPGRPSTLALPRRPVPRRRRPGLPGAVGSPRGPREVSRPRAPARWGRGWQPRVAAAGPRRRVAARPPPPAQPAAPAPHARAAPLPAERRGACCFLLGMLLGPPQPSPQPPPEFAGRGDAGTRGPGAGATPRRAQLWPRPRGLRAPGAPRTAGAARMDRRARGRSGGGGGRAGRSPAAGLRAERAGPGRRARSHPRRGPRAQQRALGGPARGPRSMPLALCWAGAVRAPPAGRSRAFLGEPRVSARNFLGPSLLAGWGSRRALLVRGSQLSHCAPARPIGLSFPPALSLGGRKQTRQRSEAPVHTCAGGDVSAAPPSKQSQIKQCHPLERHFVPRAAPGGLGRQDLRFFRGEI